MRSASSARTGAACRWAAPPAWGWCRSTPTGSTAWCFATTPGGRRRRRTEQWEERIAIAQKGGMPALLESTMQRWFPPETLKANPPHMDMIRQMILTTPVNGFIGCSAALGDHDFRPLMPKVKNPVLYMSGEKDGQQRRRHEGDAGRSCRARNTSCCPAPATSPTWISRRCSPRRCGTSWRPDRELAPAASDHAGTRRDLDQSRGSRPAHISAHADAGAATSRRRQR